MFNLITRLPLFALALGLVFTGCSSDDQASNSTENKTASEDSNSTGAENHQAGNSDNNQLNNRNDDNQNATDQDDLPNDPQNGTDHTADWLGPLEPEQALKYMKETYDQGLVIVDVTPIEYKLETGFTGSIYIPYTELDTRLDEIPSEKPVIIHCVRGRSSAIAYPILQEKRKDIPVLSYIAGEPLIDEFNNWLKARNSTP